MERESGRASGRRYRDISVDGQQTPPTSERHASTGWLDPTTGFTSDLSLRRHGNGELVYPPEFPDGGTRCRGNGVYDTQVSQQAGVNANVANGLR